MIKILDPNTKGYDFKTNYGIFSSLLVHNQVVVPQKIQQGLSIKEGDSTIVLIAKIDDTKDIESQIEKFEVNEGENKDEQ